MYVYRRNAAGDWGSPFYTAPTDRWFGYSGSNRSSYIWFFVLFCVIPCLGRCSVQYLRRRDRRRAAASQGAYASFYDRGFGSDMTSIRSVAGLLLSVFLVNGG